jgi:hypothetical protein
MAKNQNNHTIGFLLLATGIGLLAYNYFKSPSAANHLTDAELEAKVKKLKSKFK